MTIYFLLLIFFFLRKRISLFFIFHSSFLFSQVLIGDESNSAKGVLELSSQMEGNHLGGLVLPKVNDVSLVKTPNGDLPVEGTMIYDISRECIRVFTANKKTKNLDWSSCLGSLNLSSEVYFSNENQEILHAPLENNSHEQLKIDSNKKK